MIRWWGKKENYIRRGKHLNRPWGLEGPGDGWLQITFSSRKNPPQFQKGSSGLSAINYLAQTPGTRWTVVHSFWPDLVFALFLAPESENNEDIISHSDPALHFRSQFNMERGNVHISIREMNVEQLLLSRWAAWRLQYQRSQFLSTISKSCSFFHQNS